MPPPLHGLSSGSASLCARFFLAWWALCSRSACPRAHADSTSRALIASESMACACCRHWRPIFGFMNSHLRVLIASPRCSHFASPLFRLRLVLFIFNSSGSSSSNSSIAMHLVAAIETRHIHEGIDDEWVKQWGLCNQCHHYHHGVSWVPCMCLATANTNTSNGQAPTFRSFTPI